MLSKDRCKTTSGFFVIPLFSQLWEEKNYCERRKELSSWRPVALQNRPKHLCLFKLGYDVHVLLSSVMYILSGKTITSVYPMSRRRWDQNTTQVANRLNRARATYGRLLHVPPWYLPSQAKLWCTLPLRGQIHSPSISPLPLYVLCGYSTVDDSSILLDVMYTVLMEIIFLQMYHNNSIFSEENLQLSGTSKEDL